ncbi:unnamed protein product, partial [Brachionus calyciflorus]
MVNLPYFTINLVKSSYQITTLNKESTSRQGDSGGGHFFKIKNRWYVYALTSFGIPDQNGIYCSPNTVDFETMVPKYLEWIKKAMAQSFNPYEK